MGHILQGKKMQKILVWKNSLEKRFLNDYITCLLFNLAMKINSFHSNLSPCAHLFDISLLNQLCDVCKCQKIIFRLHILWCS
jgi:hypothetical protein